MRFECGMAVPPRVQHSAVVQDDITHRPAVEHWVRRFDHFVWAIVKCCVGLIDASRSHAWAHNLISHPFKVKVAPCVARHGIAVHTRTCCMPFMV